MNAETVSTLLMIVGGMTVLTNIVVQVLKSITWDKLPTNLLALIVAEVLTLTAGGAYASMQGVTITWYMVVATVVVGFMSAYASMFGFDKLNQTLQEWEQKSE